MSRGFALKFDELIFTHGSAYEQSELAFVVIKESQLEKIAVILGTSVDDIKFWKIDTVYFIDKNKWDDLKEFKL